MSNQVLMSAENPDGWKLEDLLAQLQEELMAKTSKIMNNSAQVTRTVMVNNLSIIEHLKMAEITQREIMAALAVLGPDQGPTGQPRIG